MVISVDILIPISIGISMCIVVSYVSFYVSKNLHKNLSDLGEEYMYKPLHIDSSPPLGVLYEISEVSLSGTNSDEESPSIISSVSIV